MGERRKERNKAQLSPASGSGAGGVSSDEDQQDRKWYHRVWNTISGAGKGIAADFTDAEGALYQAGQNGRIAMYQEYLSGYQDDARRYERSLKDELSETGLSLEDVLAGLPEEADFFNTKRRDYLASLGVRSPGGVMGDIYSLMDARQKVEAYEKAIAAQSASGEATRDLADELQESGDEDIQRAKKGLGLPGRILVDAGVAGAQMAADAILGKAIGVSGTAPMAARVFGGSTQKARQEGASLDRQLAYGTGSAALSVGTEMLSNMAGPFRKAFGKGVLDDAISNATKGFGQSTPGRVAISALSEGGEELVEDFFQPILQRATYDKDASFDLKQALYDAAIGATLGGIGGVAEVAGKKTKSRTSQSPIAELQRIYAQKTGLGTERAQAERDAVLDELRKVYIRETGIGKEQARTDWGAVLDELRKVYIRETGIGKEQAQTEQDPLAELKRIYLLETQGGVKEPNKNSAGKSEQSSGTVLDMTDGSYVKKAGEREISQGYEQAAQAAAMEELWRTYRTAKWGKPRITMEEFTAIDSSVWNNVPYEDTATQTAIAKGIHQEMVDAGEVVEIPVNTLRRTASSYPDLRGMKKAARVKTLRQKYDILRASLKSFLNGVRGAAFKFEVNGKILEARLYSTGIAEVLEKIDQDGASMLYHSGEIFRNAKYLYSTPDYDSDPNVYRWNYFYTPVKIGDKIVGVRIAVRDMKQTEQSKTESQIYNWDIKKYLT